METTTYSRFVAKSTIDPAGCWVWNGYRNKFGHGQIKIDGKAFQVHRAIYQLVHQIALPSTRVIRHNCDNPGCWRPSHLQPGTHQENVNDRVTRGRSAVGSRNGRSKLVESDIPVILSLIGKKTIKAIAEQYGVDRAVIRRVRDGKTWRVAQQQLAC